MTAPQTADTDSIVSPWAEKYADWAMAKGIVRREDGIRNLTAPAPRYQIAMLLHRFSEQYGIFAAADSRLEEKTYVSRNGTKLNYLLYTPTNAKADMPLIVYLHGGSAKGVDISLLTKGDGFPQYVKNSQLGEIPAYVLIPQLSADLKGWTDINDTLTELVGAAVKEFRINRNRISLTGHSMGGTGAWNVALRNPDLFSRIAPLSGSIKLSPANVELLSEVSVWAFVGTDDTIVAPSASIHFIDALNRQNGTAKLTVLEGATHFDVPALAYLDEKVGLMDWLSYVK